MCTQDELHYLIGTLNLQNLNLLSWALSVLPFAPEKDELSLLYSKHVYLFALHVLSTCSSISVTLCTNTGNEVTKNENSKALVNLEFFQSENLKRS